MSFGFTYTFPALKGKQAGKEYYVVMCPLELLSKIFLFDDASLPPELRAQRTLNTARIPDITNYILENRNDYAFSAITVSIDGEAHFESANSEDDRASGVGFLIIPMSAHFVINDGQHRRAAIEEALKQQPDLRNETIAVVFYIDVGLQRSQQLYADLNKHAVRPTQSLGILYDHRDPLADLARDLAEQVFCFKGLMEKEKTTISNRSVKLFTLSGIYQATEALLGKQKNEKISEEERNLALRFWTELGHILPQWELAAKQEVNSAELRHDYVHVHSVVLYALGLVGHSLLCEYPQDWPKHLSLLGAIDWRRSNIETWEGRAMIGGQMSKVRQNVQLTTNLLKTSLGLELTPEEAKLEKNYTQGRTIQHPSVKTIQSNSSDSKERG